MAQEQFAGKEYFADFDPEKFINDLKNNQAENDDTQDSLSEQS